MEEIPHQYGKHGTTLHGAWFEKHAAVLCQPTATGTVAETPTGETQGSPAEYTTVLPR